MLSGQDVKPVPSKNSKIELNPSPSLANAVPLTSFTADTSINGTSYQRALLNNDDDEVGLPLPQKQTTYPDLIDSVQSNEPIPVQQHAGQAELDQLIVKSTLANTDSKKQQKNVVAAFNRDEQGNQLSPINFVTTGGVNGLMRGKRIEPGNFAVFHTNNVPFLVGPSDKLISTSTLFWPGMTNEKIGIFKQNIPYFEAKGVHVINVPPGHLALITDRNERKVLGEGVHVIHSQTLQPVLGEHFVPLMKSYIHHGNLHLLRIPIGKIATVLFGNKPLLLEGREESYFFNDPTFALVTKQNDQKNYFYDATEKLIRHGNIKRLMPHSGEVAVTYDGSELVILKSKGDGKPIMITKPNHDVPANTFLQVNVNGVTYPPGDQHGTATTRDGIAVKMKMNINYSISNPELAVQQLAVDGIAPQEAILRHIESCAMADMTFVIQTSNFFEAQEASRSTTSAESTASVSVATSAAPKYFSNIKDQITDDLTKELEKRGIKLTRIQFSEFSYADDAVKKSMTDNAQKIQQTYADVSRLTQQAILNRETAQQNATVRKIEKDAELDRARLDAMQQLVTVEGKAQQNASTLRIKQEQDNQNLISAAKAELEAAKIRAEALLVSAKAEVEALRLKGEIEARNQGLLAEMLGKNPHMLQLKLADTQAQAMAKIQGIVVSPETARSVYAVGTPSFFGQAKVDVNALLMGANKDQVNNGPEFK